MILKESPKVRGFHQVLKGMKAEMVFKNEIEVQGNHEKVDENTM